MKMQPEGVVSGRSLAVEAREALIHGNYDKVYLCAREMCQNPPAHQTAEPFACAEKLATVESHVLHGYDLALTWSALGVGDPFVTELAASYAKRTLLYYLSSDTLGMDMPAADDSDLCAEPALTALARLAEEVCYVEEDWTPCSIRLKGNVDARDPLIVYDKAWFEQKDGANPVLFAFNHRLAQAATFLAVNSVLPDNKFDEQVRFLWGRFIGMVWRNDPALARELATEAAAKIKKGAIPVGSRDPAEGLLQGRALVARRWQTQTCLGALAAQAVLAF